MFIDYYALLGIVPTASKEEIKRAFKKQALKWHPDVNKGPNAKERMQLIIEAYKMLIEVDTRNRYDATYYQFLKEQGNAKDEDFQEGSQQAKEDTYNYADFEIRDPQLSSFIQQAKAYAKEKVDIVTDELKGSLTSAASTASGCLSVFVGGYLKSYIIGSIIIAILFAIGKSCHQN